MKHLSLLESLLFLVTVFISPFVEVVAYRKNGWPCRATFQCESEYCNSTLLCDAKKENAQPCDLHDACKSGRCSGGVCQVQQNVTLPCSVHEDCREGYCDENGACALWKDREVECVEDYECRSMRCTRTPRACTFTLKEGSVCGKDNDCEGRRCKTDRGLNQRYDRKWPGAFCVDNSDCWSLRCEGVAPARNCTEPVWLGEPCDEPSDCYSLFCNSEKAVCVASAAEIGPNDVLEEEFPGIVGSTSAEQVYNGGGTGDVSSAGGSGGTDVSNSSAAAAASIMQLVMNNTFNLTEYVASFAGGNL